MRRTGTGVDASFLGEKCPPGSRVAFRHRQGKADGVVTRLRLRCADVTDAAGTRWEVPYAGVEVLARAPSHCSLAQVQSLGRRLIAQHTRSNRLAAGWTFGFDLSPSRAGVCRYDERRIDLSVSFCLRAPLREVEDTLLHELAHAIVGKAHGHDAAWQATAREIGCSAERCHQLTHSIPSWVGECGCATPRLRQRLQRTVAHGRVCARCRQEVRWRRNLPAGASPPP